MSIMEIIFLVPFVMFAIALYIAFDGMMTIAFDNEEEHSKQE